jgi:Galactose oxidase, central domain
LSQLLDTAIRSFTNSNFVVLFEGRMQDYGLGDTWTYDALANTWQEMKLPPSPSPRFDVLSVAIDFGGIDFKYMNIIGGRDKAGVIKNSKMWAYHWSSSTWAEVSVSASPSTTSSVVRALGRSRAAGGATNNNTIIVSHENDGSRIQSSTHFGIFTSQTEASAVRGISVHRRVQHSRTPCSPHGSKHRYARK